MSNPFNNPETVTSFSSAQNERITPMYFGDLYRKNIIEISRLSIPRNGRMLDIGCGAGRVAEAISFDKNIEIVGIDNSEAMIVKAKQKEIPNANFLCQETALGFENLGKFDIVVACGLVMYQTSLESQQTIENAISTLNTTGRVLFNTMSPFLFDPSSASNHVDNFPFQVKQNKDNPEQFNGKYFSKDGNYFEAKFYNNHNHLVKYLMSRKDVSVKIRLLRASRENLDKIGGIFEYCELTDIPMMYIFEISKIKSIKN